MAHIDLETVLAKLRWCSDGTTWVALRPEECKLLLAELEWRKGVMQVDPVHNPDYVMGPGDDVPRLATAFERIQLGIESDITAIQSSDELRQARLPYIGDPGDENDSPSAR